MAQAIAISQSATNTPEPGIFGRSPQVSPLYSMGVRPARKAASTSMNNCDCRRRVVSKPSIRRASSIRRTRPCSNKRLPLNRSISGG
ncbi:hypothetical protein D3C81_1981980 [compost metagenome]